jgi:hypothetical protein
MELVKISREQPEVELLLSCARIQLTPEISTRIREAVQKKPNWMALIRLAMRHDVVPLLSRHLQQVCPNSLPQEIFGPLVARNQIQATRARRLATELVEILSAFEKEGILAVPYKGPVLAERLYGDLSLREFVDLDIMVLERDVPKAQELIRRFGFEFSYLKNIDTLQEYMRANRELQFHRCDGVPLELHWRFAMRSACVGNDPERFLQRLESLSLSGVRVSSLSLEDYFLILCLHATKHKWRQLKLICDIAELLKRTEIDWRYVLVEADNLGLKRMIAVGALLADDLLDVAAPAELEKEVASDRTAPALADEVKAGLFEEPDEAWHEQADFPFQFKIRERLRDKVSMLWSRN